ncbi:MAG: hypothetical protein ACTMKW_02000 [Brevibacterium aurantiacum]
MARTADVGTPRTVKTIFRQTESERARLDEARGDVSASEYMRSLVSRDLRERGL